MQHPFVGQEVYYIAGLEIKSAKVIMIRAGGETERSFDYCTLTLSSGISLIYDNDNNPKMSKAFLTKKDARDFLQSKLS